MADYFNDYFFTSDKTNQVCPGFGTLKCNPQIGACARDPNTGKRYCCDFASVCWTRTSSCATDGSTIDCGNGVNTWCCLNGRETCTQSPGQINICWSSAHNTLTNISSNALHEVYSSLTSAKPSASSYTFDPAFMIAVTVATSSFSTPQSQPATSILQATSESTPAISTPISDPTATATATSTSTSTSTSTLTSAPISISTSAPTSISTSASTSTPTSTTSPASPSHALSVGAMAGIIISALAALAFLTLGFYLFTRRRKQKNTFSPGGPYEIDAKILPVEVEGDYYAPQELDPDARRVELQGSYVKLPELEAREVRKST